MAASTHLSPRTFCLCCRAPIDSRFLAFEFAIHDPLYGFCSPACELNYGCRLEQGKQGKRLSRSARTFLVTLQDRARQATSKTIEVYPVEGTRVVELAKAGLVVRHGRSAVSITVKGDIAFIRARLVADRQRQAEIEALREAERAEYDAYLESKAMDESDVAAMRYLEDRAERAFQESYGDEPF